MISLGEELLLCPCPSAKRPAMGRAPRAPSPRDAAAARNKHGDWAEGQEFKSLFYSSRGKRQEGVRGFYVWILVFSLSRGGEWSGREGRQPARGNTAKQSSANANQTAAHLPPDAGLTGRKAQAVGCLTLRVLAARRRLDLSADTGPVCSPGRLGG